jgi:Flp pilus assembly protein TadG
LNRHRASRRGGDRGQTYLWAMWLCLMLFGFGGLSLDLWRSISAWRSFAATADAAAAAGASGIDEAAFRTSGGSTIQLDPATAEALAYDNLASQADDSEIRSYTASATTEEITVVVNGHINLALLGIFADDDAITLTATATADPRPSG